ncbi:MAG: hypothetical protein KDA59_22050, partial [Planctomycetales bacterium]|nr:hypothetical protein [Planctomycetales bacterium]
MGQRVVIDADDASQVVLDHVIDDDRLSASYEDRRGGIDSATGATAAGRAGSIVLERAVRDTHIGLMNFDCVESGISAFDGHTAAAVCNQRLIDATAGIVIEDQSTPLTNEWVILIVFVRVERSASTEPIVRDGSEDHFPLIVAFGNQVSGASFKLDPRIAKFHDDTGINM